MQAYQALLDVLSREDQTLESLIDLGTRKQQAMNDVAKLSAITREEERLIRELQVLEEERLFLLDAVAPGYSLAQWSACNQDVVPPDLHRRLAINTMKLQAIQDTNRQLVEDALSVVQFTLGVLTGQTTTTYARAGTQVRQRTFIDRKV